MLCHSGGVIPSDPVIGSPYQFDAVIGHSVFYALRRPVFVLDRFERFLGESVMGHSRAEYVEHSDVLGKHFMKLFT